MPKSRKPKTKSSGIPYAIIGSKSNNKERRNDLVAAGVGGKSSGTNLVAPNTGLGQHFLKNPAVVTAIVEKAGIKSTDVVLEIGPGTGNMTVPLLQKSRKVNAIEYDDRMTREVLKRVEGTSEEHKLTIIQGDAIKVAFPFFDVCVANVPYQISSALVFKLLSHRPMFRCAVMMFQEEFALRLSARPGEALYCRLSVNCQLLAKVDQLMKVGRNNFRPPPKVESRVVRIELRNPPPPVNFSEWDGMIRLLFNRKNKTLRSVLKTKSIIKILESNMKTHAALNNKMVDNDTKLVERIIDEVVDLDQFKDQRAGKLDLDDFLELLVQFNRRGIHFA
mmetsp:Transcript_18569/g.24105  ORF Transcript_18569/g.24105 Transcript_18569/m.24105 type:complete len:334 (+) Transcript_18569:101-1102(+)|eukprot:CAMPEP_0116069858 /NCGR_PEP_ID=MMETSP0322-20121206/12593_1 /TAXON_ID=163516 /ORGANISM="Leptocylindrus danicus var. apora, Strain B651" /LENGTH=333 /DNA_ID=CAMNT_0003557413 /DNA_START=56 /DNA_END=1057 /DNA_ORIENTATION=+